MIHNFHMNYPLVICYIAIWKDPPFFMGKSTISTGPFSIAMLVYQRVSFRASHELSVQASGWSITGGTYCGFKDVRQMFNVCCRDEDSH